MKTHLLYLDNHEWFRRTEEVEILSELISFFSLKQTKFSGPKGDKPPPPGRSKKSLSGTITNEFSINTVQWEK